jgi:hypothetical protein
MDYAPEHYSKAQLDELDRLTTRWIADHFRRAKRTKRQRRTRHSRVTRRKRKPAFSRMRSITSSAAPTPGQCQQGYWIAIYVYDASGNFNQLYTYNYR